MSQVNLQTNIKLEIKDIINLATQLDASDFDKFKEQIDKIWLQNRATKTTSQELKLIEELGSKFSQAERSQHATLVQKSDTQTITSQERGEMLRLFEKGQADYLRRLEAAKKLANLREVDYKIVLDEFGLLNPANV